jgi:hypothetical protein
MGSGRRSAKAIHEYLLKKKFILTKNTPIDCKSL